MVTNNDSYEEQTRRLLAETMSELNTIEAEIENLEEKRAKLRTEAQAYEGALEGYLRRVGRQFASELDWAILFEGQTHKEKLVTIAVHSNGRIRVNQATDLLYSKGFIKSKKRRNAYTIVQALLADMVDEGKFEKVVAGEYRLVGAQQGLLQ